MAIDSRQIKLLWLSGNVGEKQYFMQSCAFVATIPHLNEYGCVRLGGQWIFFRLLF